MDDLTAVQRLVVWSLPLIFAVTLHEVAHGWVALKLGDRTAQMLGRLTLNPIKHIDLVGTIIVPGFLLLMGGFIFGWAKPVPVSEANLRAPQRRSMALVALAGPAANLLMAFGWAGVVKIGQLLGTEYLWFSQPMVYMGLGGVMINLVLMILNLLPLPPLDGGRIVSSFLPGPLSWKFDQLERFGLVILLGLMFTGILGQIIMPVLHLLQRWIFVLFAL